jgi:hypothetical protein
LKKILKLFVPASTHCRDGNLFSPRKEFEMSAINTSLTTAVSGATSAAVTRTASKTLTTLRTAAQPATMTVAQAVSAFNRGQLSAVVVSDSATNIQRGMSHLARLADIGVLRDVTFKTRNPAVSMTASQLQNSKLLNAVKEANLSLTGNATAVTMTIADATLLWDKNLTSLTYNVSDTASNLQSSLASLHDIFMGVDGTGPSRLGTVKVTAGATTPMVLSAEQALSAKSGNTFLQKLVPSPALRQVDVEIIDSADNYNTYKSTLANHATLITEINIIDGADKVQSMLENWSDSDLSTFAPKVSSITINDGATVAMKVSQVLNSDLRSALTQGGSKPAIRVVGDVNALISNISDLEAIQGSYPLNGGVKLVARDTVANIMDDTVASGRFASNASEVERLLRRGTLGSIEVTDVQKNATASVGKILNNPNLATAFAAAGGAFGISDTAANISSNLGGINDLINVGVVSSRAGGITVTNASAQSIDFNADQYGNFTSVRAMLGSISSIDLKLGNADNIVGTYKADLRSITTGSGQDSVYVGNRKDMTIDLGAGDRDTVYLTGSKADWTVQRTSASALRDYLALEDRTNATTPTWSSQIASTESAITGDVLPAVSDVEQAYRFTTTNTAGATRSVYVLGAERYAFFDNGAVPRSTVNLLG